MLADIEAGLVDMVIVKDMSRFGRNYLEVGLYTEIRFPEMGVRFIAVNDGVDSENQMDNIESFLKTVRKYTEPTELTPALLHELVGKIVVHEGDKSSGKRVQQIDVHYNFIGEIDLSPEYSRGKRKAMA